MEFFRNATIHAPPQPNPTQLGWALSGGGLIYQPWPTLRLCYNQLFVSRETRLPNTHIPVREPVFIYGTSPAVCFINKPHHQLAAEHRHIHLTTREQTQ